MTTSVATDLITTQVDGHVAVVEWHRPPANFFDRELLSQLADAVLHLDGDPDVRCIVLCSEGKHFCAGADLRGMDAVGIRAVYREAQRLFSGRKPLVAAVQGAAVGGGLGLAMAADFRVAAADARLTANFAKLGFHQGFALSVTLPPVIGQQKALELLYTGRDVSGTEAAAIGLCDRVVPDDPRPAAVALAQEIAASAPLALVGIRATMRRDLLAAATATLDLEALAQASLLETADFAEGISAAIEKRPPEFKAR
jgi:enoyl-CoA hydratase/carnithine racemase